MVLTPSCVEASYQDETRGVGEVQVFVHDSGDGLLTTTRLEIVEYEEGRRALARSLDDPLETVVETTVSDENELGHVIITHTVWVALPTRRTPATAARLQDELAADLDQLASRLPLLLDGPRPATEA